MGQITRNYRGSLRRLRIRRRAALLCTSIAVTLSGIGSAEGRATPRGPVRPQSKSAAAVADSWGADVNRGAGPKLIDAVDGELLTFVRLAPAARTKRAPELAKKRATAAIEGWKRFRNPELIELARACLDHSDWHIVHRALHWLVALQDRASLARALTLIDHAQPLLRERALLATLDLWDDERGSVTLGGDPSAYLSARRDREKDPHLRAVYAALLTRIDGSRPPQTLAQEVRQTRKDRLVWTPFLSGASQIGTIAVDAPIKPTIGEERATPASAISASKFMWPLLQHEREEVANLMLQPFGKPRREGALFHTGIDFGGCRDGSGYYAIAAGVVRSVDSGGTAGTRFVLEFRRDDASPSGSLVNAVYMHASARVFVQAGETVQCGQLLGTMAESYSFENGGHFAHLHFGLYPGPYNPNHNHGYQPAAFGLDDWFDPSVVMPQWVDASKADADNGPRK
ncbi:MAG: hypothetical protein EXS13_01270 [Planctomycetes bacterium]|nr:hypothetical protein [Planctomycetota bacterium]